MSAIPCLPEEIIHTKDSHPKSMNVVVNDVVDGAVDGVTKGVVDGAVDGYTNGASTYKLHDTVVENFRPIKVIVIGAGYSGIYCGIRIPEKLKNVDLVIYEKNAGIGGTWWENRYPGCACDIPSHSYQFSFEPNHHWSSLYAPSHEIQAYLERTAKKYSADRFMKLSHEVKECRYDEKEGKWHVKVLNHNTGQTIEDTSDVLISARGNLNNIAWPEIEGLRSFKGEIMHSASWNEKYEFKNKRIGVIGSGSSAIQIIPSLQKLPGTQISTFVRSRTWISPPFGQELWDKLGMTNYELSEEQRKKFASDPEFYQKFRLAIEEDGNAIHGVTIKGNPMQIAGQKVFEASMKERLASAPHIFEAMLPKFAPGCRRLTPGRGYLEALTEPNVAFIKDKIERIEPSGIRTADGKLYEIDVLVCATGFHTSAPPPFPVLGRGGVPITKKWAERATSYLSLAVDGYPNHFMMLGPNSAIGSGSLTMMIESVGDYVIKAVRKLQKENIRSMSVHPARVDDFVAYADAYFANTVFMDDCKSWYRKGDKVTGLWPGSTLHCIEALRSPRWEDYEYEYREDDAARGVKANRMAWLGNGWSVNQIEERDLAWYLYPEFVDKPAAPFPEESKEFRARPFSH